MLLACLIIWTAVVTTLLCLSVQAATVLATSSVSKVTPALSFWVLILVSFTSWCRGWRHALSRRSVGIERYLLPSIWINYVSRIHVPIWVFSFENDLVLTIADMIQVIFEEVIVSWAPSSELKWWCHSGLQAIPSVSAWLFLATLCVCDFPGIYWTPPNWMCETSVLSVVLYFYY